MVKKHLVIIFWDLGIGGIQTRFVDVINQLLTNNDDVIITLLLKRKLINELLPEKSNKLQILYYSSSIKKHGEYKSEPIGFGFWLLWKLITLKPTHLLTFLCRYFLIGAVYKIATSLFFRKINFVINEGILTSKYIQQHEKSFWKHLVSIAYSAANRIIVPTNAIQNDLVKNFNINSKKIEVCPSWVSTENQKVQYLKKFDGLYVGRFAIEKGFDTLIKVIEYNKGKKFAIAGDGELKKYFYYQLKKKQLLPFVTYFGYQNKCNIRKLMRISKLLILPSENEGLPMVVLEAGTQSLSSLCTPLPGIDEIITDNQTGYIQEKKFFPVIFKKIIDSNSWRKTGLNFQQKVAKNYNLSNLQKFVSLVINCE